MNIKIDYNFEDEILEADGERASRMIRGLSPIISAANSQINNPVVAGDVTCVVGDIIVSAERQIAQSIFRGLELAGYKIIDKEGNEYRSGE